MTSYEILTETTHLSCTVFKLYVKLLILAFPNSIWHLRLGDMVEFCQDLWHQDTRFLGLSHCIVCMILR